MADAPNDEHQKDFAHAFGDALSAYLNDRGIGQSTVARLLGIEGSKGEKRKGGSRIYSYLHDSKDGKRTKPDAEILYLACSKLAGFTFTYNGYRISAATLNGNGTKSSPPAEQIPLDFERQFNLTDKQGTIAVRVRRPSGRIEVSLSLEATGRPHREMP